MLCLWQGTVNSVYWPRKLQEKHDLRTELWLPEDDERHRSLDMGIVSLHFLHYARIGDIPFYQICGSELLVMSRCSKTVQYFTEFSTVDALCMKVRANGSSVFDQLIVCFSSDKGDNRIVAHPMNTSISLDQLRPRVVVPRPVDDGAAQIGQCDLAAAAPQKDTKRMLQDTIMAALRLRGVRSNSKNFKKLYYSVYNLVDMCLSKTDPQDQGLALIHEKVEAILTLIE